MAKQITIDGVTYPIHWSPQEKQSMALMSNADEILFGGARGGGKTDAGQAWLLYDIENPRYRGLVIRRNADDLRDWIDRARYMFQPTGAVFAGMPPEIRFPSGAIIRTGHLKDENAYSKYQGHEYQKMVIEELSQISREHDYLKLLASCRSTVGIQPQIFCTTNPDEPGLEWIKKRWSIPDVPDFSHTYKQTTVDGRVLEFIPAKMEDNPLLMNADPAYVKFIDSYKTSDPDLYDAWRNGNWKGYGIEGAYYRNQLIMAEGQGRIKQVPYDPLLLVHTWCDLGISDSFAIGYFQQGPEGWRVIDYDEFEGESLVEAISRMRAKEYRYGSHYAPHDIEVRDLGSGKTRWEIAKNNGVKYEIVPNLDVAEGINAVRTRFPSLWFDEAKCELLLQRLRRYHKEYDDKHGMWKDRPYHDSNSHAADMMRYWATSKTDKPTVAHQYVPKGLITQTPVHSIANVAPQYRPLSIRRNVVR